MSAIEVDRNSLDQKLQWVVFMGDFPLLKNLLAEKRQSFFWMLLGWIDALLRGFGQVVFANNPISGIVIMITFGFTVPGILMAAAGTGFLGLLLSLLLRDTGDNIENGLTVYNPVLIGSVTYALAPNFYGSLDAFAILIIIVGTIFSVYLTRSLATGRFPCITVPFNVVEMTLLLILTMQRDFYEISDGSEINAKGYAGNGTTVGPVNVIIDPTNETFFEGNLNWGLVFRGIVTSASQVYGVDNVAVGSVIYLGIVVYSPITAFFSLLGAVTGSLMALGLNVPLVSIYAGLWGYNSLLTGAAFGGLFLIINGQTGIAAFVAIIFTTLFQYIAEPLMAKIELPVLTIPFVVTAWLFFGLRDSVDGTFPRPTSVTFPENERYNFRSRLNGLSNLYSVNDNSDPEIAAPSEKKSSND